MDNEFYLYICEKHNFEKMLSQFSMEWISPCPHCNEEAAKYAEEQTKKGNITCHWCGEWFKPNKRTYLLCDPEDKQFRYTKPSEAILEESCGIACGKKCQINHSNWEWDSGPYSGR